MNVADDVDLYDPCLQVSVGLYGPYKTKSVAVKLVTLLKTKFVSTAQLDCPTRQEISLSLTDKVQENSLNNKHNMRHK